MEYRLDPEVEEMLNNPIEFDEDLLRNQTMKTLAQACVGFGIVGVGIYYMYRSKVDEMENNPDVKTVEVFVDEHDNIISRDDIESSVYKLDLDREPIVSVINDGELHSVDPEVYNSTSNNPLDNAKSAYEAYRTYHSTRN